MVQEQNLELLLDEAKKMIDQGREKSQVKQNLISMGASEETIETILNQIKSLNYLKRRKRGFILGICGSILLIVGFALTVIFFHKNMSIDFVMYGMTSVGVILLVAGLVEIIGW
ncbi:MAG TPA: hypothetical protein PKD91_13955 [Bacteroidia bacterium]|nr:hypothetical protein [Bacteroidia bacterium]